MTTTSRLWTLLTQIKADGRKAAVGGRTPKGRRASFLSIVAFGIWVAASIGLATEGAATGDTAPQSAIRLPPICATVDLKFIMLIEAHGEAQDVAAETLARAFFTVLEARKACNEGQVDAAIKLYESIPLGAGMSRKQ
jgi:hypothetical protein